MIPKFSTWIETGVSEPQDKIGEGGQNLNDTVKRRIDSMVSELQSLGKGTKENILSSLKNYLVSMGVVPKEQEQNQNKEESPDVGQESQNQIPNLKL